MSGEPASELRWLSGSVAMVTGAAKRLGAATAIELARCGADLVLHYHTSSSEVDLVGEQVRALGVRAFTVSADLSHPAEAQALFTQAVQLAGPIDILINNASIFPSGTLGTLTPDDLHRNIDVNALTPTLLAREFSKQSRPGSIINFLDARIIDYDRDHLPYHLSKQMLFSLTRIMALEYAPGVRVNAVAPGLILPPEGQDESYLEGLAHTTPLQRHGSASDITDAVLFLLKSSFITGQVLFVDGGRHMKGSMYGL